MCLRIQGATVIGVCVNIAYLLSVVIYPYMPNVASTIRKQLNVPTFNVTNESELPYDSDIIKPGSLSDHKTACLILILNNISF